MSNDVKLEPCPLCETGSNFCRITTSGTCKGTGSIPAGVRAIFDCDEFDRNVSNWATRLGLAFAAWNARHQPQREAVLEIRAAVFEAVKAHHTAPALLRRDMLDDTLTEATSRILAALKTTPAPAVSRQELAEALDAAVANQAALIDHLSKAGRPQLANSFARYVEGHRAILSRLRGEG